MTLLRPSHFGDLTCTVSVPRRDGGTLVSSTEKIGNVFIDTPIVETNLSSILSDQIEYVLYGHNFDRVSSGNVVQFESHCNDARTCSDGCDTSSETYPELVLATVQNVTIGSEDNYDEMTIHFETLAPYFGGCQLRVSVETGNVSASESSLACVNASSTCWIS